MKMPFDRIIFLILNSSLFALAMGWLEGVVVVYLRTILARRPDWKTIEISREAATLVMLLCFALLAGRNRRERWGVFLWIFAIWDMIYYVCLRVWTGWPAGLATMDTLFYIPCAWSAPVYVPVLFSALMMLLGLLLMLDRGAAAIAAGGGWALAGWLAGLLFGLVNAGLKGLPLCVSAMGLSVCFGLIAFGAGAGAALAAAATPHLFLRVGALAACGLAGGILAHLARSMFYVSPYSCGWPVGAGLITALTAGILVRRSWRRRGNTGPDLL